ncbi:cell division protein CrgA [Kocuria rhizosphaericola]|uniref:cell division protein CrgA n=1 Tax=Kocuria rhizosphaericola TaxID=3376284 RepID=UPI00379E7FBF
MPESKNRRKKPARRSNGSGRTAPPAPTVDAELARLAAEGLPGGSTAFDPEAAANAVAQELTERSRHGSPAAHAPTPTWYKAIMLGLLVVGLLWLILYYLFQGAYPVPGIGTWNIGVGLALMMAGLIMTTRWR